MERLLKLCGNAMAAFMDFGVGTFITALLGLAFGLELPAWAYLVGGVLGFLPDFDVIWSILYRGHPQGDHHQTLMHRPIVILPITAIAGWLLGGAFWSATATACVFWHYLHDTPEFGGGGVAWFWPFSKKYWSFRNEWISPERSVMANSETDHKSWIEETWLKPSAISCREIEVGAISIGIASTISEWGNRGWWSLVYGVTAWGLIWLLVLTIWMLWRDQQTKNTART